MSRIKDNSMEPEDKELIEITNDNLKEYADELQFDTLSRGQCIVEDLCTSYGISKSDMMILVAELRKRGNNIKMNMTIGEKEVNGKKVQEPITVISNFGHQQLIDDLTYKIKDDSDEIKILVYSDLRMGSKYQQLSIVNEVSQIAKNYGAKYFFVNGDLVEGVYTGAKSIYNFSLFKEGPYKQAENVINNFPRIDGVKTHLLTGEHDLSFLKTKKKVDIGNLVANEREDIAYLGPKRKRVAFTNSINGEEITLYFQHAKGKVPYTISYKPQQIISSLRNEDKTDILLTSHFLAAESFLRRGVRSYQVPSMVATTDEMRDEPTPVHNVVGAWLITLKKDKKQRFVNTSQMFIPYYNTIKDDYLTFKPLVMKDNQTFYFNKPEKDDIDNCFKSIKNGETVEDICKRLGVSELKLNGLIEEMRLKDYNILINEKDGINYINKKVRYRKKVSVKTPINELTKFSFTAISDTHFCNEMQQLGFVNWIYKETDRRGIKTVLHMGDMSDGDYKNRPDHQYALFRLGASRQVNWIADNYPRVVGITTYFITGNHDSTHMKNGGADFGQMLSDKRSDLIYLGSDRAIYKIHGTKIEKFHSGGGNASSLSYKMQKYIDKMEPGNKPNMLLTGHFHQSEMMFYRNMFSFLVPCTTDKTPFAVTQALENTMGCYFIDAYINKKGEIEMLEFEEKRFHQKECKKDDYIKTKKLIISH